MIDRISRHAAQHIWHSAIQHHASTGVVLCSGDCIVDAICLQEGLTLAQAIQSHSSESSWQIGGMFHTALPTVEQARAWEDQLAALELVNKSASLVHVYLDLHAAGLLKLAAYTIVNDAWLARTLTMEQD